MATSGVISCRWDWCRSSFPSIDALDAHVKHAHIWPMKPMRKAEIALMRRMDHQSLHSSLDTDSSIISGGISSPSVWSRSQTSMTPGLVDHVSQSKTPPPTSTHQTHRRPEIEEFDTFAQLSSPPQSHSPQRLPASPALEGLMRQKGHSGLSAAVEIFERTQGHEANQRRRLPSHQRSPTRRPLSRSSGSSQEVVERQLTQEDDVASQPQLPSDPPIENELTDPELKWPTDDELGVLAAEEMRNSEKPASKQNFRLGISDSARGQYFRCGSLNVPLGVNTYSASHPASSQGSHSPSSLVLQTQAPYSSQATGWSQTQ